MRCGDDGERRVRKVEVTNNNDNEFKSLDANINYGSNQPLPLWSHPRSWGWARSQN